MTTPDLAGLTASQLREVLKNADSLLKDRLAADINSLVDDIVAKAKAWEVDLAHIVHEIQRRTNSTTVVKATVTKSVSTLKPWATNTSYCDPSDPNNKWVGGQKGPKPKWLLKLLSSSLTHDEQKVKFAEIAVQ
jgi:hypothetical protein